jgi:hypothetical protein
MDRRVVLDEIKTIIIDQGKTKLGRSTNNLLELPSIELEFALLVPSEYDLLLQSNRAEEICNILRKLTNTWLKVSTEETVHGKVN